MSTFNQSAGQGQVNPEFSGLERDFLYVAPIVQGDPVIMAGNYQVQTAAAAGAMIIGYAGPVIGGTRTGKISVETRFKRISTRNSGAAIAIGAPVTVNALNQLITWVSGTHAQAALLGIALTAAGGAAVATDFGEF